MAADGGIFSFNAPFYGSTGSIRLNAPIVGMDASGNGAGYRFVASDGGIFSYSSPFYGSMGGKLLQPNPSSPWRGPDPSALTPVPRSRSPVS